MGRGQQTIRVVGERVGAQHGHPLLVDAAGEHFAVFVGVFDHDPVRLGKRGHLLTCLFL